MQPDEIRAALRALPPVEPPAGAWDALVAARARERRRRVYARPLGFALAASVVMAVALLTLRVDAPAPLDARDADLQALLAHSHDLDRALAGYDERTGILDLQTADTIAALEDRLALVDGYLRGADSLAPDAAADLLRRRVQLAQALVDVHAARIQYSF